MRSARLQTLLLIAISGMHALACSTISATNYLKAEWSYRSFSGCASPCVEEASGWCAVSCARVAGQAGGDFQIYARGGTRIVATGPCLLPVLPNDAPLLDSESISLVIRLDFRSFLNEDPEASIRVMTSSMRASFSDGSRLLPNGLNFRAIQSDSGAYSSFLKYAPNNPEYGEELEASYQIAPHTWIELPFLTRSYAGIDWVEIQPRVAVDRASGQRLLIESPRVRLTPARDYDYSPFELPRLHGPLH